MPQCPRSWNNLLIASRLWGNEVRDEHRNFASVSLKIEQRKRGWLQYQRIELSYKVFRTAERRGSQRTLTPVVVCAYRHLPWVYFHHISQSKERISYFDLPFWVIHAGESGNQAHAWDYSVKRFRNRMITWYQLGAKFELIIHLRPQKILDPVQW